MYYVILYYIILYSITNMDMAEPSEPNLGAHRSGNTWRFLYIASKFWARTWSHAIYEEVKEIQLSPSWLLCMLALQPSLGAILTVLFGCWKFQKNKFISG